MLRAEPIRVVFNKGLFAKGDDLLEQRGGLLNLAVSLVGNSEGVLQAEPVRVVLGEVTIPPLASLFQTPYSFLNPSIYSQAPSYLEQ